MAQIKICGLTRDEDVLAVNTYSPDYAGFVFAESRRRVTVENAARLAGSLHSGIRRVGVFVDGKVEFIAATAEICGFSAVQLHGNENREYIGRLREELPGTVEIWRAVRVRSAQDVRRAFAFGADRVLFDAFSPSAAGGTGTAFDWSTLGRLPAGGSFFLAGGITPVNIGQALRAAAKTGAADFGIDVSSGAETGGVKDPRKISALVNAVRAFRYS